MRIREWKIASSQKRSNGNIRKKIVEKEFFGSVPEVFRNQSIPAPYYLQLRKVEDELQDLECEVVRTKIAIIFWHISVDQIIKRMV